MYQIQLSSPRTARTRITVQGGANTPLSVQEWGLADGPAIVFAHAFGTNHLAWQAQTSSDLAKHYRLVTFDHRGHGESGKPEGPNAYDNSDVWADDFDAVLKYVDQPAIVVAWSMSGSYLGDYVAKYGARRIAGINFSAASNTLGTPLFTTQAGAAFGGAQGLFSDDLGQQMQAYAGLNTYLTHSVLDVETAKAAYAWLALVPLVARRVMFGRDADHRQVYRDAGVPILVSHGRDDQIVIPRAAEMLKETVPSAELSWYDAVGHTPHWEGYERFNNELSAFATKVFGSVTSVSRSF
jgi:pimeloyl-ACP methyl ester carboxylesterase